MLKLFVRLYGVLMAAVVLYIAAVSLFTDTLLKETVADHFHRLSRGTAALIEQRLTGLPPERLEEEVRRIDRLFGYPIELVSREDGSLEAADRERLDQGLVTYARIDHAAFWYLPLAGDERLLRIQMEETDSEYAEGMTLGTFNLIEARLRGQPEAEWEAALEALRPLFHFELRLLPMAELALPPAQMERLEAGRVAATGVRDNDDLFYRRLGEGDRVLRIGPMGDPPLVRAWVYVVNGLLALLAGVVIWWWVRPMWRNITELRRVTARFGRGEFSARAAIAPRAPLGVLGETFNAMAVRIQGLIESHRELTDAVSHELRTPISRLRFAAEMLGDAREERARRHYLDSIQTDLDELEGLVGELLDHARFERADAVPRREPLSLPGWLARLAERAEVGEGPPVELDFDRAAEAPMVNAEPRTLARAVENLLLNARRYARSRVRLRLVEEEGTVSLRVEDDGPGVPPEERERIFEPFARLDRSRDRESGGYGLGLAIVRRTVQRHGGEVTVGDSPLGGASFHLNLPTDPTHG